MLTTRRRDVGTEATTEVASLKKALSEAEHKAALELKELKKQEDRVGVTPTMRLYLPRVEARLRGITA